MIARVTQTTVFRELQQSVARLQRQLFDAQETVSSQKRLREPSDDPAAVAQANRLRADLNDLGALHDSIGFGSAVLGAEDSALEQADAIMTRAREIATQEASGLSSVVSRQQAAEEVEALERGLLTIANTDLEGRHVFGGLATGPAPFLSFDDPGFTPGTAYTGPPDPFVLRTGSDQTVRLTTPGDAVFSQSITALDDLRQTLAAGTAPVANVDAVETASAGLRAERASVGGRQARLLARDQEISTALDGTRKLLGTLEDADPVAAISELVQVQQALQAVLASSGQLQISILDFLT